LKLHSYPHFSSSNGRTNFFVRPFSLEKGTVFYFSKICWGK
jgi:hypothetical protein